MAARAGLSYRVCRCRRRGCAPRAGSSRSAPKIWRWGRRRRAALLRGRGRRDRRGQRARSPASGPRDGRPGLYIAALAIKAGTRLSEVGSTFTGDDRLHGRLPALRAPRPRFGAGSCRSSPGPRSSTGCAARSATRSWTRRGSRLVLEATGGPEPAGASRSTVAVSGIATTTCSGICCRRNSGGGSPSWSRIFISGRRPGTRRTPCRRPRSSMPRRPGTTTGSPAWYLSWPSRSGPAGASETVLRWMEWLRDIASAEHYGAIAVHGSLIFALLGQPGEAERWATAAERASAAGILPDGSSMREHAGVPARDPVSRRRRRDAARRADRLGRAEPGEPVPGDDAVHRGHLVFAAGRPGPGRPDPRPLL